MERVRCPLWIGDPLTELSELFEVIVGEPKEAEIRVGVKE